MAKSYIPSWSTARQTSTFHPLAMIWTFGRYRGPRYVLIKEDMKDQHGLNSKKFKPRKSQFEENDLSTNIYYSLLFIFLLQSPTSKGFFLANLNVTVTAITIFPNSRAKKILAGPMLQFLLQFCLKYIFYSI